MLQGEYTECKEWAGAGTALFPGGLGARCQGSCLCLDPDSWLQGVQNEARGWVSQQCCNWQHLACWKGNEQKQRAVYLAVNGKLCWLQWELDLVLCLFECFGIRYCSKWIFFSCLISGLLFLLFLKCTYLAVISLRQLWLCQCSCAYFSLPSVCHIVHQPFCCFQYRSANLRHWFLSFLSPFCSFLQTTSIWLKPLSPTSRFP